jgi:lysine-N-methylase
VGWTVFFDQGAYEKYQGIPAGSLRTLIDVHVIRQPVGVDGVVRAQFARVQMSSNNVCPFLNVEKLCQIQAEHGEDFLSVTCATYPRIAHRIDGLEERALSLSCPEAARLVLLTPHLLAADMAGGYRMTWNEPWWDEVGNELPGMSTDSRQERAQTPLQRYFWPIREFVIHLLVHREYALWQRLFLLGIFTRRLDALARGELDRGFVALRHDFSLAVDSGRLRGSMDAIPADLPLQLDMVLRLAGMRLPRSHVGARFVETIEAFKKGIGNGPGATIDLLIENYARAYEQVYEPFFRARPHILENLLINAVFRTLFPFGNKADKPEAIPGMAREFALLASQFALIKGLLIGVAGCYGAAFCEDHVVKTVQSASKHFEHHPGFLDEAYALLVSSKLDNARGLTMLVRN